jgi:hypothetical protein
MHVAVTVSVHGLAHVHDKGVRVYVSVAVNLPSPSLPS